MLEIGRWKLRVPEGTDGPADVPLWLNRLATDLSDVSKDNQGTLAARPVSTAVQPSSLPGRYYFVTGDPTPAENHRLYRDTGTGWLEIPVGAGRTRDVGEYKYAMDAASHAPRVDNLPSWVLLDGGELAAGYTALIAKHTGAGSPFGTGPGGRPRVFDARGRTMVHPDGAANRLDANDTLGAVGGAQKVTLVSSNLPTSAVQHTSPGSWISVNDLGSGVRVQGLSGATPFSSSGLGGPTGVENMQPYGVGGSWFVYAGPVG